ncbi:MAG: TonB family protein, partial [Acidobacteria bacterium]|nr:TonB family protein [Acidobacteriota bacterium]
AGPLAAVRAQEKPPALQERVASKQSIEYGAGLLKIADLEKTRHRPEEAEAFYAKAAQALGDRPEAVPALIYLGLRKNNPEEAIEYFQKAQRLDPLHAGPALMWMALIREREQKPAEAESLYKSALAVEKPDSAEAADTSQLYARFLNGQGREEEGRAMLDRATAVRKELFQKEATQLPIKAGTNVLRIGDGVKPPALISKVEPEYTQEARFAKHQGKVVVYAEIGPDGMAGSMRIVQGIGFGLDENAIRAISNWRFQPGTKDGVAVTVAATIEVNYRLL